MMDVTTTSITASAQLDLDRQRDRYLAGLGEGEWFTDGDNTLFVLNDSADVVTVPNDQLAGI